MRYLIITIICLAALPFTAQSQCTTTNGVGCLCLDGTDTCDLLPDLTVSWDALENYASGPNEYSQSGNGANDGRLRVTGSTPNIGYGSFTVRGTDYYVCGNDTIHDPTGTLTCPDLSDPRNLLHQRIYRKEGPNMVYEDRWAGSQTYHPTHGHNHVDDWVVFTLRQEDPNEPDTLQWPIIGNGAKIGFCLMDYGTCDFYNGHCRDVQYYGQGNVLTSNDFPNYALGGGSYGCSPVEQGISVGYTDIYSENLDGMWIDIPDGTCNGNYWIVVEVDPRNNFLESNENNNWTAIPFELTQQVANGQAQASMTLSGPAVLCGNQTLQLEASLGTHYNWNTGDTTKIITVSQAGDYYVDVMTQCGNAQSDTLTITQMNTAVNSIVEDSTCDHGVMNLTANGTGTIHWYNDANGSFLLGTGSSYTTPDINTTTTYYVSSWDTLAGLDGSVGPAGPWVGGNGYNGSTYNGYLVFDVHSNSTLESVMVKTEYAGDRTIELRDDQGTVLASQLVTIDTGETVVTLNFTLTPGTDYQLGTDENTNISTFGSESPEFVRNNGGINYPYSLQDVVSITTSRAGTGFYYYFYDWKISGADFTCQSPLQPVQATVNPLPTVTMTSINAQYYDNDQAVALSGTPAGGTFSGPGVNGANFDPAVAGIGGPYTITYTFTDAHGCSNTTEHEVSVVGAPSGIDGLNADMVQIYPNPNQGSFTIDFSGLVVEKLEIVDATGRVVLEEIPNSNEALHIELENVSTGFYKANITTNEGLIVRKIVVE